MLWIGITAFLALIFVIMVSGLLGTHIFFVNKNYSSIEYYMLKYENPFENDGPSFGNSFTQHFGKSCLKWLLPIARFRDKEAGEGMLWDVKFRKSMDKMPK